MKTKDCLFVKLYYLIVLIIWFGAWGFCIAGMLKPFLIGFGISCILAFIGMHFKLC